MALTGVPLLVLVILLTAGAVAVSALLLWNRYGGWRRTLVRAAALLCCEALAACATGLFINRELALIPSWSALFDQQAPGAATGSGAAALDRKISAEAARRNRDDLSFAWTPSEVGGWGLAKPPTVYVPPRYLRDRALRFPVVVIVAGASERANTGGWDDGAVDRFCRSTLNAAGSAVVVLLRTTPSTTLSTVAAALPDRLARDVRVGQGGWALIGVGAKAPAVLAVARDSSRYGVVGVIMSGPRGPGSGTLAGFRALPVGYARLVVAAERGTFPAAEVPDTPRPGGTGGATATAGTGSPPASTTPPPTRTSPAPGPSTARSPSPGGTSARSPGRSAGTSATPGRSSGTSATPGRSPGASSAPAGGPATVRLVTDPAERLAAAVRWAYQYLPPPLAAPLTVAEPVAPGPGPKCTGASGPGRTGPGGTAGLRASGCAVLGQLVPATPTGSAKPSGTAVPRLGGASPTRSPTPGRSR